MSTLIRLCPKCKGERPTSESYCKGVVLGRECGWPLSDIIATQPSRAEDSPFIRAETQIGEIPTGRFCVNGHQVEDDEFICMTCGADVDQSVTNPETGVISEVIDRAPADDLIGCDIKNWFITRRITTSNQSKECFAVELKTKGQKAFLTLYLENYEPDQAIYDVLGAMDHDHVPDLIEYGRWRNRAYEIYEWITGGTLLELGYLENGDIKTTRRIADELGRALRDFADLGLRHRDISPRTVLIREVEPLDLVIADFGSARLSDFDLDTVAPLELTKYSAPEAIVGGVSAASDWWGLGMILLEQVTRGGCFRDINDKAFMIHIVTRGIEIPEEVEPSIRNLLRGLLARDPVERWQWDQVKKWLDGEPVTVPRDLAGEYELVGDREISLDNIKYRSPQKFALAAAEEKNWEEAKQIFLSGALATWAGELFEDGTIASMIQRLQSLEVFDSDWCFSLALMALNHFLPLTIRGQIVSPAWLLENPIPGYQLVVSKLPLFLETMGREQWLVLLHYRRLEVIERARVLEIELNNSRFKIHLLATSRANLDAEKNLLREIYPTTNHSSLLSLMEKNSLSEEELIILLSAEHDQFIPLQEVVNETKELFDRNSLPGFDVEFASSLLCKSRRDIYEDLNNHIAGFARCGNENVDNWADSFRVERRILLPRTVAILSIPKEQWIEPDKHEYSSNILRFFERRVTNSVLRGSLVRLTISKTTSKIDLTEFDTPLKSASSILEHLIKRDGIPEKVDPAVYQSDILRDRRIFRMLSQASTFRRDTGVDSLYLGFPFLIIGGVRARKVKPKIAPVLLWPVAMEYKMGAQGSLSIRFDRDREEVRLNPALEGLLGREKVGQWRRAQNDVLASSSLSIAEVMNTFGSIVNARSTKIDKHPTVSHTIDEGVMELESSAVIFNAQFTGQSISEDIRRMQTIPLDNTVLEPMLRISEPEIKEYENPLLSENDRFSVVPADPSQDKAVIRGRTFPGLVVEGPPGTGKSQTIVNVIADSIGRRESVLVVCQKQAALRVVEKRLEAEALGHRIISVTDINRDRQKVIRSVRDQLDEVFRSSNSTIVEIQQHRSSIANKIDRLEKDLNQRHQVVHDIDAISGMSYRALVGELIELETTSEVDIPDVPQLRTLFFGLDPDEVNIVEESCSSLANDWLLSGYEKSSLGIFRAFPIDEVTLSSIKTHLIQFIRTETARSNTIKNSNSDFDRGNVENYSQWLKDNRDLLSGLSKDNLSQLVNWFDLFYDEVNAKSMGVDILEAIEIQYAKLQKLDVGHHDNVFFDWLYEREDRELLKIGLYCESALKPITLFSKLNPIRFFRVRRITKIFNDHKDKYSISRVEDLRLAVYLEQKLRTVRSKLVPLLKQLEIVNSSDLKPSLKWLNKEISSLIRTLKLVVACMDAVKSSPLRKESIHMIQSGDISIYHSFFERIDAAIERAACRSESYSDLEFLKHWVTEDWYKLCALSIENNDVSLGKLGEILSQLDKLKYYQAFRLRSKGSPGAVTEVFSRLRLVEDALLNINVARLGSAIRNIIRREALLGWKLRIEQDNPSILMGKSECDDKVRQLADAYQKMHRFNQKLLIADVDSTKLGSRGQWREITGLRGPKYKKLREFFDQGMELGLMEMRPVWLMSPDVVSQVLPLKSCLFDVVIFDEASQVTVDYSIPALYRAKRVIISGDEKQMPPTSFFSSHIESDEDNVEEEIDDNASEAEVAHHEEVWNRKEIKDCPDLLALGKGVLPTETLQIHYRSEYRALINYSNSAFYGGKLNIPALHPEEEVNRVKPIEVISVMGTYIDQSNQDEAEEIVKLLSNYWSSSADSYPSIGVVTFNRKQAELIGDVLQAHAESDSEFYYAYTREQEKMQNGEDMGFFIKPVENVQGDERDVIIFSTTFGRNEHGDFRRSFGVLGHRGGERRLNVAITRARSKVVVVTSMPIREISDMLATGRPASKPRDYLQGYLYYATKVSGGQAGGANISFNKNTDQNEAYLEQDGFFNSVEDYITKIGYQPSRSSNTSDAFKIDIALENPDTNLYGIGIECDSPENDLLTTAKYREIWRPAVLSKSMPKIHRVSCYDWYHDRENEQKRLQFAIKEAVGEGL